MKRKDVYITIALMAVASTVLFAKLCNYQAPHEQSIVKVLNNEGTSGGTGWVTRTFKGERVIITNEHVCAVAGGAELIRIDDNTGKSSLKRILKHDKNRDLCEIAGVDAPALRIAERGPVRFQSINVLGHPLLKPQAPSRGVYTGDGLIQLPTEPMPSGDCRPGDTKYQTFFGELCIQTMELSFSTVPIFPGNSGSPVTNDDGDVVGVMNSASTRDNMGMFIPLVYVRELLAD